MEEHPGQLIVPDKINRKNLFFAYVEMQAAHISRLTGIPTETLVPKIMDIVKSRYQPKRVTLCKTIAYGNTKTVEQDLWTLLKSVQNDIITPSGSVYKPAYQCQSIMSKMVADKLKERKKVKKLQLKAAGEGDDVLAKRCWYKQATIKINCNSIPGGFGSEFNILYDKGGYNAITSTARCMIARAYMLCEQLLGGNFSWFSIEELVNHIVLNLKYMPSAAGVRMCMEWYHLRQPTKDELFDFYKGTMAYYVQKADFSPVKRLVDTLTDEETAFLYYYCNLRHIIWENSDYFRPWIDDLFSTEGVKPVESATKDDAFAIDDTVSTLVTVAFTSKLGGYGLVDICNNHPEYIPPLVGFCKATEKKLHELDYLMNVFVNTGADVPMTHLKPHTWRNTTIVSDTDSVIFTAGAWDDWYRKGEYGINEKSLQISSLVIYWLHHAVKFALKRFSIRFGFIPDEVNRLAMKNEFLFPVMLIYPIKKTYAGLQLVQEGVVYKTPKLDIKGQTLRGSSICQRSLDFAAKLMNEDILEKCMVSRIKATDLIDEVVAFENMIKSDLDSGSLEFLKITSLKYERDYKTPETTSVFVAWKFWEDVMTAKYDHIHPPTKVYVFKRADIPVGYFDWLETKSKSVSRKMKAYLDKTGKLPNQLIVDPVGGKIPEELRPLIDKREIVYTNLTPVYGTLKQLGLTVGCESSKYLFSDIY